MEAHENCQHTATDDMLAEISGEEWVIEMADGSTSAPGASKALTLGSADSLPEKASRQAEELADLTPAERIAKLFDAMPGQKAVLFGIVDYCREPRSPEALDSFTAELQKTNVSVFTPVLLRQHLESAGALAYEEPDGDAATAQDAGGAAGSAAAGEAADGGFGAESGADAAADNGDAAEQEAGYLVVSSRPAGIWTATADGLAYIDSFNPASELSAMLAEEPEYLEIFRRILEYCSQAPRSKEELNALVDDDPILQSPRRYSGYFIDRLKDCGALKWQPRWQTTPVGQEWLAAADTQQPGLLEEGGAR